MSNLFVPYEIALIAKEKGFDEKGLAGYNLDGHFFLEKDDLYPNRNTEVPKEWGQFTAPLYQQLTDWFREKHNLAIIISIPFDIFWIYSIDGINGNGYYTDSTYKEKTDFSDYYEALNEALKEAFKLIK